MTKYVTRAAQDAAVSGWGGPGYADYLESSQLERAAQFRAGGNHTQADYMLTRSLSEALAGNDGA